MTFHTAVGVHNLKALDYIKWACLNTLPRLLACRQSLAPLNSDNENEISFFLQSLSKNVTSEICKKENLLNYLDEARRLNFLQPEFNLDAKKEP